MTAVKAVEPTVDQPERPTPGVREQHSTRAAFFIAGVGMAAWAPLVPYAKMRLGVDEGTLGLLLLCLGAGSIIAMPMSGLLAARYGCRAVISAATLVLCLALPLLALVNTPTALALALLLFGASVGTVDVSVNTQAVIVEKASNRALMSGFHGLFSVGGIVGAAGVSGLLSLGAPPVAAMIAVVIVVLALLAGFGKYLLPYGSESNAPLFVPPRGIVLLIGFLCFISFLAEGAMLDWSAIFLMTLRSVDASQSGLGYVVFALAMTTGRLTGDAVVRRLGGPTVVTMGALCAAFGLLLAVFVPAMVAAVVGFGLVGLGASNIVPVLYSVLGRQTVMPPHLAVASVTFLGYSGILTGPALIGFVARGSSLPVAFTGVAALLLLIAVFNPRQASRGQVP